MEGHSGGKCHDKIHIESSFTNIRHVADIKKGQLSKRVSNYMIQEADINACQLPYAFSLSPSPRYLGKQLQFSSPYHLISVLYSSRYDWSWRKWFAIPSFSPKSFGAQQWTAWTLPRFAHGAPSLLDVSKDFPLGKICWRRQWHVREAAQMQ